MSTLGITLKEARKNVGLTLRQVEDTVGVSNAYLSQLENGKIKNPSVNILSKLSSVYHVPLKVLLVNSNLIEKEESDTIERSQSFAQRVAFRSEGLSENEKNEVLRYLDYVKTHKNL